MPVEATDFGGPKGFILDQLSSLHEQVEKGKVEGFAIVLVDDAGDVMSYFHTGIREGCCFPLVGALQFIMQRMVIENIDSVVNAIKRIAHEDDGG